MLNRYYECHITIEPVFDDRLSALKMVAGFFDFKVADLLMYKKAISDQEPSRKDTFLSGRSDTFEDLEYRMKNLLYSLKVSRFAIWRYKIELVLLDSNLDDEHGYIVKG